MLENKTYMGIVDDDTVRSSQVPLPDPRYWGSKFWFTMHTIAYFYPSEPTPEQMAHASNFYSSLASLLPCPGCAAHYARLLQQHPVDGAVTSRSNLIEWVNRIHNEVNRRLGKPIVTLEEYFMMNRNLEKPPMITYEPVLLGIILALVVLIIARRSMLQ